MDKAFHGGKNQLSFWSIKMKIFCLKVKKKKKKITEKRAGIVACNRALA